MALAAALRFWALGSIPPGLYHDEAFNGLDALGVLKGERPIFFEANNGREPLFIYLVALSVAFLGRSPGAIRIVAAVLGTLTIPATYLMAKALFNRRIGLLSAAIAGLTLWHVNLSRIGFRAVAMPLLVALALWQLWLGFKRGHRGHFLAGGMLYGLTLYTYLAARFTIVALAAFGLYLFGGWRLEVRGWSLGIGSWRRGALVFALTALVVSAPLMVYVVTHTDAFLGRVGQVSIFNPTINEGDFWGTLLRHVGRTLLMFTHRGDFIPRHNVPLRPVFDPVLGAFFLLGLILCLGRFRRRPNHALVVIWLAVMLLPTILAEDAPHFLRSVGVLPVAFVVPAIGLDFSWRFVTTQAVIASGRATAGCTQSPPRNWRLLRAQTPRPRNDSMNGSFCPLEWRARHGRLAMTRAEQLRRFLENKGPAAVAVGVVALVLMFSLGDTTVDYFGDHAASQYLRYNFETAAVELATQANRFLGAGWDGAGLGTREHPLSPGRHLYIVDRLWRDWPSVRFLVPPSPNLTILTESATLSRASSELGLSGRRRTETEVMLVLWPYEDYSQYLTLLPVGSIIAVQEGALERGDLEKEARLLYIAYTTAPATTPAGQPVARFEKDMTLIDHRLVAVSPQELRLSLLWRAEAEVEADYAVFVHLTRGGAILTQDDSPPAGGYYPTSLWRAGDIISDEHTLVLPEPYDAARHKLIVGFYQLQTLDRLQVLDELGKPINDHVIIE